MVETIPSHVVYGIVLATLIIIDNPVIIINHPVIIH